MVISKEFILNGNTKIHFRREGDGTPLVLILGIGCTISDAYEFGYVDSLAIQHDIIIVEPRGHGESSKPHLIDEYSLELMASDLINVLDYLSIPRVHFFGYSFGGRLAIAMSHFAPQRLWSLVVGGADPYQRDSEMSDIALETLSRGTAAWADLLCDHYSFSANTRKNFLRVDPAALSALRKAEIRWGVLADLVVDKTLPRFLYAGETCFAHDGLQRYGKLMRNSYFRTVGNVNHFKMMAEPEIMLPDIRSFLREVERCQA